MALEQVVHALLEKPGLVRVLPRELASLKNIATRDAVAFELDGAKIADCDSFFEAVRAAIPLNPPVLTCHWDALADSLGEGLYNLPDRHIIIFWSQATVMQRGAPSDYATALEVLADVAASLAQAKFTVNKPKVLTVLIDAA